MLLATHGTVSIAGPNRAVLYIDAWFAPHSTALTSEFDARARYFACQTSGAKAEITGFIVGHAHPAEGGMALALVRAEIVRRRLQDLGIAQGQLFLDGKVDEGERKSGSLRTSALVEIEVQAVFPMKQNFVVERPDRDCTPPAGSNAVHEWLESRDQVAATAGYKRISSQMPHKRAEALIAAYEKGRSDLLELVLTRNEVADLTSLDRGQLLAAAIRRSDASMLERLIRQGAGPSRVLGDNVLKVAVCAENAAIVRRLLVHGFGRPANTADLAGAWRCAMRSPNDAMLNQLLHGGGAYPKGQFVDPPLFANPGRLDRIERLVAAGVPGTTTDDQYRTAFHYVALNSPDVVRRLVRMGVPVNAKPLGRYGSHCAQPALPVAVSYAPVSVVAALVAAGAKLESELETTAVSCRSAYRTTVLSSALRCDNKPVVDFLWGREPINFMQNSDGHTHLHDLAYNGYEAAEYVGPLVAAGVPVDSRDAYGSTPLLIAVANRSDRMVEQLLRYGADPRQLLNDKARSRHGGRDFGTLMEFALHVAKSPNSGASSGFCHFGTGKNELDSTDRRAARRAAPTRIVDLLQAAAKEGRP